MHCTQTSVVVSQKGVAGWAVQSVFVEQWGGGGVPQVSVSWAQLCPVGQSVSTRHPTHVSCVASQMGVVGSVAQSESSPHLPTR
jgi:hypothetical protein